MNVLFVEPSFPNNQREFVRALHATGATVWGLGERPADWLDPELRGWLAGCEQVGNRQLPSRVMMWYERGRINNSLSQLRVPSFA